MLYMFASVFQLQWLSNMTRWQNHSEQEVPVQFPEPFPQINVELLLRVRTDQNQHWIGEEEGEAKIICDHIC